MSAVFVFPCEGILFLLLLPEDLEHSSVIDEVEAVVHGLQRDAFSMNGHLVNERFCLLFHLSLKLAINHDFFLTAHL